MNPADSLTRHLFPKERDGAKQERDLAVQELGANETASKESAGKVAAAEAARDEALGKVKQAQEKVQETEDMVESLTLDLEMEKVPRVRPSQFTDATNRGSRFCDC